MFSALASVLVFALVAPARAAGPSRGPGFRFVGKLAEQQAHLTNADGALTLDPVHRRGYTFYRTSDAAGEALVFRVFDLDAVIGGWFKELAPIRIDQDQLDLAGGDRSRIDPDGLSVERVLAIDPPTGRIFYSAQGAVYAIDAATTHAVHKWVAAPNPGGIDERSLFLPSGAAIATTPNGMAFQETSQGARLYMIGSFKGSGSGAWVSAWDAGPTTSTAPGPEQRQLWYYPVRTCQDLSLGDTQSSLFRSGDFLYLFCNGSSDGSAVGVLRLHLSTTSPLGVVAAESAPDGQEEFFPGVTGIDITTRGDAVAERMYITSSNAAGGRSVLVFDGRASDGRGAYIGQVALSDADRPSIGTGFDPTAGRWYFQSPEGLWYQDGRLRRLAQGVRIDKDSSGANLGHGDARPIAVDTGHAPPRVFVQRAGYYAVYEDTSALPTAALPPTERTNSQLESPSTVGVYAGVTSAYGERLRLMRGLSSFWPSGAIYSLEAPAGTNHASANYYTSDPFFYHAGDCGTHDREVTVGRILATELTGGLTERSARAVGMAVDPELHRRSTPDETLTRDDVADPDPCTDHLVRELTDPNAPVPSSGIGGLKVTQWPYDKVACSTKGDESAKANPPLVGTAHVVCDADGDKPSVTADTSTAAAPADPALLVSVQNVSTSTKTIREPGNGVTSSSTSTVRGISIAGTVHLDELVVHAEAHAGGRPGTATHTFTRQFTGLEVAGQSICQAVCDQAVVLEKINAAIGQYGYARVADPEPDYTLGTTKGTLSVVQKNLLQQDADATTNRDDSGEWPGIEIGVYRDAQQRGGGRWIIQLGGVFAQAQFGVIDALGTADGGSPSGDAGSFVTGTQTPVAASTVTAPQLPTAAVSNEPRGIIPRIARVIGKVFHQVLAGIGFAVTNPAGAALLATLWCLICAPGYVAFRRRLLSEVTDL